LQILQLVYNIICRIGSSLVPVLFLICLFFFFLVSFMVPGLFSFIFSIIFITYDFGILVYIFSVSYEHILLSSLISWTVSPWLDGQSFEC
jgi:hypothetical protein